MPPYVWYDEHVPGLVRHNTDQSTAEPELSASAWTEENTGRLPLSTSESKRNEQFSNGSPTNNNSPLIRHKMACLQLLFLKLSTSRFQSFLISVYDPHQDKSSAATSPPQLDVNVSVSTKRDKEGRTRSLRPLKQW